MTNGSSLKKEELNGEIRLLGGENPTSKNFKIHGYM
jgi:hypothetical protein